MITVRSVTAADAVRVVELRAACRTEVASLRGGPQLIASRTTIESDQSAGHEDANSRRARTLVGCIRGEVVGLATVEIAGSTASLDELFVHPDTRGVGVGHQLLAAVRELAASAGCVRLDSVALPGDRDTKNFFESHAMKSRLLIVSHAIGTTP